MARYQIIFSYDGTGFFGSQRQGSARTVTALDAANDVVTDFSAAVTLTANLDGVGQATPWPLFHCRHPQAPSA